jgi:hypothetical protein
MLNPSMRAPSRVAKHLLLARKERARSLLRQWPRIVRTRRTQHEAGHALAACSSLLKSSV